MSKAGITSGLTRSWKVRFWRHAAVLIALGTLSSCGFFPESTFTLELDSRLPRWVALRDVPRGELNVVVDFVGPLFSSAYARVTVFDHNYAVLERDEATLTSAGGVQAADGTPARGVYPSYQVVSFKGDVDIFEHRAGGTLRMCDDAAVWRKLAPGTSMPTR